MPSSELSPDIAKRKDTNGSMNDTPPNNGFNETINDPSPEETIITLISGDQVRFSISMAAAKGSGLIVDTLGCEDDDDEDCHANHTKEYEPIDIPRVEADCLEKVIDFLRQHALDPMPPIQQPLVGNSLEEVVTHPWYQSFVLNMERTMLFHVLAAANFMEIPPLIDLTCLWCTFQITGKSPEEIRVLLNFPSMTPEEEAQAREDHPWVFESIS